MNKHNLLCDIAKVIPASICYVIRKNKVLMFKRSESLEKFAGFWIGPGGRISESEDALTTAIREVKEETGIKIGEKDIKLKAIAFDHHLGLKEIYINHIFLTTISAQQKVKPTNGEGQPKWISIDKVFEMKNVLPSSRHYFEHTLKDKPGILYANIQWKNNQLVEILSQRIDRDY